MSIQTKNKPKAKVMTMLGKGNVGYCSDKGNIQAKAMLGRGFFFNFGLVSTR